MRNLLPLLIIAFIQSTYVCRAVEPELPKVQVESVRQIFHNGEHNAFTDLCKFKDRYYLAFRSCPDGHMVHPTSTIIIMVSDDTKQWEQVHRFHVAKRDVRDPHFLVFKDRLFVYTGTWYCGDSSPDKYLMNELLGYAAFSYDGKQWQSPVMLEGTYGHYVWRASEYDGKAYLCGRRKKEFVKTANRNERDPVVESAMLESEDGLIWRKKALFQETYGDETAFLFEDDGTVLAVARSGGRKNAQLCQSIPPFDSWQRTDLGRYIGGPSVHKWNGHYLVGGRKSIGPAVMTLYWLQEGKLFEIAELPSGGDCSYPGFVQLSPNRAVVSYYSSHEKDSVGQTKTAIYLAYLRMQPE